MLRHSLKNSMGKAQKQTCKPMNEREETITNPCTTAICFLTKELKSYIVEKNSLHK
jgi:hypothetical protein